MQVMVVEEGLSLRVEELNNHYLPTLKSLENIAEVVLSKIDERVKSLDDDDLLRFAYSNLSELVPAFGLPANTVDIQSLNPMEVPNNVNCRFISLSMHGLIGKINDKYGRNIKSEVLVHTWRYAHTLVRAQVGEFDICMDHRDRDVSDNVEILGSLVPRVVDTFHEKNRYDSYEVLISDFQITPIDIAILDRFTDYTVGKERYLQDGHSDNIDILVEAVKSFDDLVELLEIYSQVYGRNHGLASITHICAQEDSSIRKIASFFMSLQ